MLNILKAIKIKDVVAIIAIVAVGVSKYYGLGNQYDDVITLMTGMYFGHRTSGHDVGK